MLTSLLMSCLISLFSVIGPIPDHDDDVQCPSGIEEEGRFLFPFCERPGDTYIPEDPV